MTSNIHKPGRPRNPAHDEKILETVVTLVDQGEPITVNTVVAASGINRAAIYRRWNSLSQLVATALDHGRTPITFDLTKPIKEALTEVLFDEIDMAWGKDYSDKRFRKRLQLVMENRELQEAYWQSHVYRRRRTLMEAIQLGIDRGELREDLDIEAAQDSIIGVFYYQSVVRGHNLADPTVLRHCRTAFEIIWRGLEA